MTKMFFKTRILLIILINSILTTQTLLSQEKNLPCIVIHGGAGNIKESQLSKEEQEKYLNTITEALNIGYKILEAGGSSIEAIEKAINLLENSPLFNAGKGAVYNSEGKVELDASVMCGKTLKAGAVACVTNVKNPISAAIKVMNNTEHVFLVGNGAEIFAQSQGLEIVDENYFYDEKRYRQYLDRKERGDLLRINTIEKFGTVGAVALDKYGNIAAGTSTGGMSYKKYGRVGDSPVIGAGTYAQNSYCGVSATGHGEYFIRHVVAYDIVALMAYKEWPLEKAAEYVINDKLKNLNAEGGIVAIDNKGNIVMIFNTTAMFRGYINTTGEISTRIF